MRYTEGMRLIDTVLVLTALIALAGAAYLIHTDAARLPSPSALAAEDRTA